MAFTTVIDKDDGDTLTDTDTDTYWTANVNGLITPPAARIELLSASDASFWNGTGNRPASFDTEVYDTDGMVALGTKPTGITIVTAGIYLVQANLEPTSFSGSMTTNFVYFRVNGTQVSHGFIQSIGGGDLVSPTSTLLDLAVNDFLEVYGQVTTDGTMTPTGNDYDYFMSAHWVGTT